MDSEKIAKVKRFNRFYLRISGLFSLYGDESPYSATEAMILYEINRLSPKCTASYLSKYFQLDKGYISRILNRFERRHMITRVPSNIDRRVKHLSITKEGEDVLNELARKASKDVANLIEPIEEKDQEILIHSMETIERILGYKK